MKHVVSKHFIVTFSNNIFSNVYTLVVYKCNFLGDRVLIRV